MLLTGRLLVVPVKQGDGISTLELIDGDKRKAALAGRGSKVGGYWATERLPDGDGDGLTLLIGEGVATVLSAKEATGHPAIAALSSGNLPAVAKAMRERYPAAALVILADLVKATGEPDPHAIEAARSVGGKLAIPDFGTDRDPRHDRLQRHGANLRRGSRRTRHSERKRTGKGQSINPAKKNAPAGDSEGNGWPDPQPLTVKVEPEPYPLDALPLPIRAAVEEVAGFVKAPVPMVASSALAALSLAIQAHADAKRAEKLHGPVGLFLLTIADSGERKSTCDGFFTKPIRDYEEAQAEAAKPVTERPPGGNRGMGSQARRRQGKNPPACQRQTSRPQAWNRPCAIWNTTSRNRQESPACSMPMRPPKHWPMDWRSNGRRVAWYLPRPGLFSVRMAWARIQSCGIWAC